jgi:archaemetzincin
LSGICLVSVRVVDPPLLDYLALILGETLHCDVRVDDGRLDPAPFYDPLRRQYESTRIVESLAKNFGGPGEKVLGVAEVDLYIPILTFVFGEAQLNGRAAVLSIARLRQSFYGLAEEPERLYHRAEKEGLHEVGHTLGLIHCPDYACVMHFSNSIEEVDLKGDRFCGRCVEVVRSWRAS